MTRTEPAYEWRGLLLDICRHHISPATVFRTLDAMALARLNVLHLHLSDDQAHRIESRVWPKLHRGNLDGRWWTGDEVRRVVDHAAGLGIEVVPELDMPGHTTAWIAAYPHLCATPNPPTSPRDRLGIAGVGLDPEAHSTFEFLEPLIDEVVSLFESSHLHLGGDEVASSAWPGRDVSATQATFTDRVAALAIDRGQTPIMWDEAWHPDLSRDVVIQVWRGHRRLWAAAAGGWSVILSSPYYLDLSYHPRHHQVDPACSQDQWSEQRQQLWADPTLDTWAELAQGMEEAWERSVADPAARADRSKVLGGEACLWTELCPEELVDLRLWPTLVAAADVWWNGPGHGRGEEGLRERFGEFESELLDVGVDIQALRRRRWVDLAGGDAAIAKDLEVLAQCCEPTKWYSRHAALPDGLLDQPFDRFVDGLAPYAAHAVDDAARTAARQLLSMISIGPDRLSQVLDVARLVLSTPSSGAQFSAVGDVLVRHR